MNIKKQFSIARLETQFDSGIAFEVACEQIADDYAINFAEWRLTTYIENIEQYTMSELLEIYKQNRNL